MWGGGKCLCLPHQMIKLVDSKVTAHERIRLVSTLSREGNHGDRMHEEELTSRQWGSSSPSMSWQKGPIFADCSWSVRSNRIGTWRVCVSDVSGEVPYSTLP